MRDSPAIEVREATKRYGAVTALDDVDLDVQAPATGILGRNGAGKSTLFKAMLGLLPLDAGVITILGRDVAREGDALRRRIGYVPEHECLPPELTAADLVRHLAELRGLRRADAIRRASEVLFAVGLEEERSRIIGSFSLGMRQRVKLAQALVHAPELVILDEPTNGLDPNQRAEMLAVIRRLSAELGVRVVISSHILDDIRRTCDEVVVLRDGAVQLQRALDVDATTAGAVRLDPIGDRATTIDRLQAGALEAFATDDGGVEVTIADPGDLDRLRDLLAADGIGIRRLAPAGRSLDDELLEAIG
jgi:ABC-2 type transport system ATP-binding protein